MGVFQYESYPQCLLLLRPENCQARGWWEGRESRSAHVWGPAWIICMSSRLLRPITADPAASQLAGFSSCQRPDHPPRSQKRSARRAREACHPYRRWRRRAAKRPLALGEGVAGFTLAGGGCRTLACLSSLISVSGAPLPYLTLSSNHRCPFEQPHAKERRSFPSHGKVCRRRSMLASTARSTSRQKCS